MRVKKYNVSYEFVCENANGFESYRDNNFVGTQGMMVGKAEPKEMKHDDLCFTLAVADPFRHKDWMSQIDRLSRRGDYIVLSLSSMSDTNGAVGRKIKIEKI